MCDQCSEVLVLINNHHSRHVSGGSPQLSRTEVEILLNMQYLGTTIILNMGMELIQYLPEILPYKLKSKGIDNVNRESAHSHTSTDDELIRRNSESASDENKPVEDETKDESSSEPEFDSIWNDWSVEELKRLLDFQTQLFLSNFAVYVAHKVMTAHNMEELSSAETTALHNYCEINDIDAPLLLLRNICFFIDSNGIGAMSQCFEKANNKNVPLIFAHTLITIIQNLRMWVNTPTVMSCILPLRSPIIRYMCTLSEADMRAAAAQYNGADVASYQGACSICQISTLINTYNDNITNESVIDVENFGEEMARWLLENKIVEQIFGPNLHIEIIKQSQIILNFLGAEGKINNQHLDCIWAAAQLKHCGKQVYEVLLPLIKSVEPEQNRHLRHLIDKLDPACFNESVLCLSSILTRSQWQAFQSEEIQKRKLASVAGARRALKTSAEHMSTSESESDDGGIPPSKIQRRLPDLNVNAVADELVGALGAEDGLCCGGCVPRHTIHHHPHALGQHHHLQQQHRQIHHHHGQRQQHLTIHHGGGASDSSMEGQSDLSFEDDEEEENPKLRAVVQSVMARNVQKSNEMDDGGESSEEDGGADVVVNKEGIPLPRTRGRIARKPEGFSRKAEVNEVGVDALVSVGTDEEDEDEEDEEDEDEEVSSDNEDGSEGGTMKTSYIVKSKKGNFKWKQRK
ncbi:Ubiquitin carboxyl-terminal hydrolase 34 [Bulinus truncatus]|nr:Ubiquitin carboxyl-terminal hydrolase 34 [Bulinus truncatus]